MTQQESPNKAAYYKGGSTNAGYWDYPTSSNTVPGQDMADGSGNNTNYYTSPYAYPIDSGHYTTVAGEFQDSISPYGTFDQGGNVWEWDETNISGTYRGLRGGSLDYDANYLRASLGDYANVCRSEVNVPRVHLSRLAARQDAEILLQFHGCDRI